MEHGSYENPLCGRYAGKRMQYVFSPDFKFSCWRRLWIALAESEKELGLAITDEQISEMKAHIDDIDYSLAAKYESELRHDVMAHIRTFGDCCPKAKPIIHLGATSCYVGDNTDIIQMREGLLRIKELLVCALDRLASFALKYKDLPTLAYTHFQAAQPTTVGKRATLWAQDLLLDLEAVDNTISSLRLLGCKGTTGTCASFLSLFDGDCEKAEKLEKLIAEKMGFSSVMPVSGQTYTRKIDFSVLSVLSGIAQSASKFSNDIRLLSHLKELDEPFGELQVGSSAMAYKRNPMKSERIASLSRHVMATLADPAFTSSSQWFERTLDDSANRRISIPESFLAVDGILSLYITVAGGMSVYPKMIEKHLSAEIPFMATENILMTCVKNGKDRQEIHELIREYSVSVARRMKETGCDNDLLALIAGDKRFGLTSEEIKRICDPKEFIGMAVRQTEMFIGEYVMPVLNKNKELLGADAGVSV